MTEPGSVTADTVTAAGDTVSAKADNVTPAADPAQAKAAPAANACQVPDDVTIVSCTVCGRLFTPQALTSHQAPAADGLGGFRGFACLSPDEIGLVKVKSADGTAWASPEDVAGWKAA